ncbi:MAG: LegC family aminotransferase [Oscillospiraceae bacterium]|nr:LegC family aminotransferase [Oscillospiraceae bacterium]
MSFIPLSVPNIGKKELEYVTEAVSDGWVSSVGAFVNRFEEDMAAYVKTPGAVACQSGTAGLHLSLISLGVRQGDLVIVPTLTFIAAVNPVRYVGAKPIFMDCDDSLCIDPVKLRDFCENHCYIKDNALYHKDSNRRIPALVIVHVFGNMSDMDSIMEVAREFKLKVLEDATEALGTYYTDGKFKGKMAGTIGDIGVYSFNGNKIVTTGGGGMIVSDNLEHLRTAKYLSTQAKDDELYFIHGEVGYNYRMTNLQAALGVAQLEKLESFIDTKTKNFHLYESLLKNSPSISFVQMRNDIRSNYWMYSMLLSSSDVRDSILKFLKAEKIQTRPVWGLIHEQKPYIGEIAYKIEKAYFYGGNILNIPCSSNLTEAEVGQVARYITMFINK